MLLGQFIGFIADIMDFELSELAVIAEDLLEDQGHVDKYGRVRPYREPTLEDAVLLISAAVAMDQLSSLDDGYTIYARDIIGSEEHNPRLREAILKGEAITLSIGGRFTASVTIDAETSMLICEALSPKIETFRVVK